MSKIKYIFLAVLTALAISACGGSAKQSDEQQVKSVETHVIQAYLSDHPERACQYALNGDDCITNIVKAKALVGTDGIKALVPHNWEKLLANLKVTVTGNSASMRTLEGTDRSYFVKQDGKWYEKF